MIDLLFAVAYWLVIAWAACGAVVLAAFIYLLVSDWLKESAWTRDEQRPAEKWLVG